MSSKEKLQNIIENAINDYIKNKTDNNYITLQSLFDNHCANNEITRREIREHCVHLAYCINMIDYYEYDRFRKYNTSPENLYWNMFENGYQTPYFE